MKLTNQLKEKIKTNIIESKFSDELKVFFGEAKAFAELYLSENNTLAKMVPVDLVKFIKFTSHVIIKNSVDIDINIKMDDQYCLEILSWSNHIIIKEVDAQPIVKKFNKIMERKNKALIDINSILNTCNTSNQLLEILPEIKQFLPKEKEVGKFLIPVETVASVKELIKQ